MHIPRLLISALRGGAGKTLLSLGLARVLTQQGVRVKACKKGPDYIDAAWLGRAAQGTCTNLDPFFLNGDRLQALVQHIWTTQEQLSLTACATGANTLGSSVLSTAMGTVSPESSANASGNFLNTTQKQHTAQTPTKKVSTQTAMLSPPTTAKPDGLQTATGAFTLSGASASAVTASTSASLTDTARAAYDMLLIEGNRGLFDGYDTEGSCSSAALAKILQTPVILSLDITKMTRTAAAIVAGLTHFDAQVHIGGVILNQCASTRHESIVRQSIEQYTDVPVLGALPRLRQNPLPERHMGLCMADEAQYEAILSRLAEHVREHTDLAAIQALASTVPELSATEPFWQPVDYDATCNGQRPRVGYINDAVLWFYYQENLEALQRAGAELVPLSILDAQPWPRDLQGLYLGGGFPEEWGKDLAHCPHFVWMRQASAAGMPIYAECGGFMLLAQAIEREGVQWPMCGIFPVIARFHAQPQGLGYVQATVTRSNIFHPVGSVLRGHEFHYSRCEDTAHALQSCILQLAPGTGMGGGADGLYQHHTFAAYTHLYAPGMPHWAANFVRAAVQYAPNK